MPAAFPSVRRRFRPLWGRLGRLGPLTALHVLVATLALAGAGCTDPCVALAERICNCESTATLRRACIADRITNQQGRIETSDADKAFCTEKLDTCDCVAVDENNLEACGFVAESG